MTGVKVLALTPLAAALTLPDVGASYEKFGIVGLLVLAVVAIWRDGSRRTDKLERIIESNTSALTEVRDAMRDCRRKD